MEYKKTFKNLGGLIKSFKDLNIMKFIIFVKNKLHYLRLIRVHKNIKSNKMCNIIISQLYLERKDKKSRVFYKSKFISKIFITFSVKERRNAPRNF